MLTRRGWSLLGGAVGLAVAGRALGLDALLALGTAAGIAIGTAAILVRVRRVPLVASRAVPGRLSVGDDGRAEFELRGRGSRRSPTLLVAEPIDGGPRAVRFVARPLAAGESSRAVYRIPTRRRGYVTVGPLAATLADPLGLAARTVELAPAERILVRPRVVPVPPPTEWGAHRRDVDAPSRRRRPEPSREFFALRSYEAGDDLRRVHWRSTARVGELVVRQDEAHHQRPITVWLDIRPASHDGRSFERAVEAAASILAAVERAGRPVGLCTSLGETADATGRRRLARVLDQLALVAPQGDARIRPPHPGRRGLGAIVAVVGTADAATLAAVRRLGRDRPLVAVVATAAGPQAGAASDPRLVVVTEATPLDRAVQEAASRWSDTPRPVASRSAH